MVNKVKNNYQLHATNVIYFLKCTNCPTTYIGKTNNFRLRMNNHISSCFYGNSSDRFDNHIYKCLGENKKEPYFKIHVMMSLNDSNKLLEYEHYLHQKGYDTMNKNHYSNSNYHK